MYSLQASGPLFTRRALFTDHAGHVPDNYHCGEEIDGVSLNLNALLSFIILDKPLVIAVVRSSFVSSGATASVDRPPLGLLHSTSPNFATQTSHSSNPGFTSFQIHFVI